MARELQVLSPEDAEHFVEKGYVRVEGCLDPELIERWTSEAFPRLGYDPVDRSTWAEDIVWMDRHNTAKVTDISQRGWEALCDVVGGAERLDRRVMEIESKHFTTIDTTEWSDAFIVNLRKGADRPWQPPSAQVGGWHKDGSFFRHFLDSREQGLLTILYWSDVEHQGGGTFIAPDSIEVVARYLADHPEGIDPREGFGHLIEQCSEFVEVTAKAGDFILIHPFMLHASSQNHSSRVRFMTNPPVVLAEPMDLDRDDPAEFSLIERATLRALGVERYDFRPTRERFEDWRVIA